MGEQHNDKAAAARCVQLLRPHGKHYAASGTLINGGIVQIMLFLFMYFVCYGVGPLV